MQKKRAIFFMILSVASFSIMNGLVKYLSFYHVYQIVFFRTVGTLFFTVPLILNQRIPFFGKNKKLLILRGVFGVISLTCFFESLNYITMGTAVSLRYTSPIFGALFALLFLKEKITILQWFSFLIALLGVLIIKGFGVEVNSYGILLVIISAIFLGLIFVVIRKIGPSENPLVIINYFMMISFLFSGLMSLEYWKTPTSKELIIFLSLGVFGYIGQLYMTKAFQNYKIGVVASIKYLEVVFVICIGYFWFSELYNWWTFLGILLIIIGLSNHLIFKNKKKS